MELQYVGSRGFAENDPARPRRRATASSDGDATPRAGKRRVALRELVAWILVGTLTVGYGASRFLRPDPASEDAPSTATTPSSSSMQGGVRSPTAARSGPSRVQIAAPEVVDHLLGDLAGSWTFETIMDETTLRVEVPLDQVDEALERAARALRTPEVKRMWDALGANQLEIRSGPLAMHLSVASPGDAR